jgi:periodic tryptophan protein 2
VWEWRSETYILKQQGHYFDIAHAAYSPDGAFIATGADDNKLKVSMQLKPLGALYTQLRTSGSRSQIPVPLQVWNVSGGSCFVTFKEHTAPVSAVQFLPSGTAVLSASLDGAPPTLSSVDRVGGCG